MLFLYKESKLDIFKRLLIIKPHKSLCGFMA